MADVSFSSLDLLPHPSESPDSETLFQESLVATPTQRIAWLEESLQLAYTTGVLWPRRFISKEVWEPMARFADSGDCLRQT